MTNTFSVAGNLGQDPETKQTQSGKEFVTFSVASKTGKDKTSWFNCVAFGKTAELVSQYVKKGSLVYVSGHIEIEKYEDKYYTKVIANTVNFLGKKPENRAEEKNVPQHPSGDDFDEEIHF